MTYVLNSCLNIDVNKFFDNSDEPVEVIVSVISNLKKIYAKRRTIRKTDNHLYDFETHIIPNKYFDENTEKSLQILADCLSKLDKRSKYYYDVDNTNEGFYKFMRSKCFKEKNLNGQLLFERMITFRLNFKIYDDVVSNRNYFLSIDKYGLCRSINVCSVLETFFDCEVREDIKLAIELF